MRALRAAATNPIVEWAQALVNLAVAIIAVLTLAMNIPILPETLVALLAGIVVVLNTIIQWLKLLIPAPA